MTHLYRAMAKDGDAPRLSDSSSGLGVREGHDLPVDEEGYVEPEAGGMSVTPEDPRLMRQSLRPRALGGTGRHPLWALDEGHLPADLSWRPHGEGHGVVEPTQRTTFASYRTALQLTRPSWDEVALDE